jgi:hypothetical protein
VTISLASYFILLSASPLLPNLRPPPPVVMETGLPASRYQSENDLRVPRKAIGWQSPGYDSKMRRGMLSLTQPGDFIYFSSYALAGLVSPLSSFFLVLLKHYGLRLQHLSPHSITLVVVFAHFCEMFMGGAVVSASISVVPHAAPNELAVASPRRLLFPAPDEGSFQVHHCC